MRRLVAVAVAAAVLAGLAAGSAAASASAQTLPLSTALAKSGQVARAAGVKAGANQYYAFGCTRRSARIVDCVGAIVFADGYACGQIVRTSYATAAAKKPDGRLIGQPLCGYPDEPSYPDAPSSGGGGGGGGETAICAIHGSVCISGN